MLIQACKIGKSMGKSVARTVLITLSLLPLPLAAQNTSGGDGGSGGGVICNNCKIYGGGLNAGDGGAGGSASSSARRALPAFAHTLTSFRIEIRLIGGQDILSRNWRRTQNKWVEIYPEGKKEYFNIIGENRVNGCGGIVARAVNDVSHQVFIPHLGCEGMPFYVKDGSNAWGFASEMYDVR